jgi:transposase-like protein
MSRKRTHPHGPAPAGPALALFACPNPDCDLFNRFDAGNLSVAEWIGKRKDIRRLYCNHCGHRFSERQGSLLQDTKLPEATVVRIIKCLGHGCSVEATADICEVDPRTVERLLERAGQRANDFHHLQWERLRQPPEAVELDELHGRVHETQAKKGGAAPRGEASLLGRVAAWVASGFTRPWRS